MSRKNISLHAEIDQRAAAIIAKRGFSGLSDMIAVLVREEYERRGLDVASPAGRLNETGTPYKAKATGKNNPVPVSSARAAEIHHAVVQHVKSAAKPPPQK